MSTPHLPAALALLAALATAAPALAGPPAALAPRDGSEHVRQSFHTFAEQWMAQLNSGEARTTAELGASVKGAPVRFRLYGDEFQTELRPTGSARAPWVGILRYSESVYRCTDKKAEHCRLSGQRPVSEVFRFQNGKWIY